MLHEEYFNKIYNTCVALPPILFEKIITCKSKKKIMHEKEKSKQKKENAPNNVIISMRYVYGK